MTHRMIDTKADIVVIILSTLQYINHCHFI